MPGLTQQERGDRLGAAFPGLRATATSPPGDQLRWKCGSNSRRSSSVSASQTSDALPRPGPGSASRRGFRSSSRLPGRRAAGDSPIAPTGEVVVSGRRRPRAARMSPPREKRSVRADVRQLPGTTRVRADIAWGTQSRIRLERLAHRLAPATRGQGRRRWRSVTAAPERSPRPLLRSPPDAPAASRLRPAPRLVRPREAASFPGGDTKDPYAIWVSEVMLQQTTVETASFPATGPSCDAFLDYPALARAHLDDVLAAWSGLATTRARGICIARRIRRRTPRRTAARRSRSCARAPRQGDYMFQAVAAIAFGRLYAADGCEHPARRFGAPFERHDPASRLGEVISPARPADSIAAIFDLGCDHLPAARSQLPELPCRGVLPGFRASGFNGRFSGPPGRAVPPAVLPVRRSGLLPRPDPDAAALMARRYVGAAGRGSGSARIARTRFPPGGSRRRNQSPSPRSADRGRRVRVEIYRAGRWRGARDRWMTVPEIERSVRLPFADAKIVRRISPPGSDRRTIANEVFRPDRRPSASRLSHLRRRAPDDEVRRTLRDIRGAEAQERMVSFTTLDKRYSRSRNRKSPGRRPSSPGLKVKIDKTDTKQLGGRHMSSAPSAASAPRSPVGGRLPLKSTDENSKKPARQAECEDSPAPASASAPAGERPEPFRTAHRAGGA